MILSSWIVINRIYFQRFYRCTRPHGGTSDDGKPGSLGVDENEDSDDDRHTGQAHRHQGELEELGQGVGTSLHHQAYMYRMCWEI